jgi:hypothetical protein
MRREKMLMTILADNSIMNIASLAGYYLRQINRIETNFIRNNSEYIENNPEYSGGFSITEIIVFLVIIIILEYIINKRKK